MKLTLCFLLLLGAQPRHKMSTPHIARQSRGSKMRNAARRLALLSARNILTLLFTLIGTALTTDIGDKSGTVVPQSRIAHLPVFSNLN